MNASDLINLGRHANFAVTRQMRANFSRPSQAGIGRIEALLDQKYFPSWYSGIDLVEFKGSDQHRIDLQDHLWRRIDVDRFGFIPWIMSISPLAGQKVLEIGCGTGSASVAMAEQGATVIGIDVHEEALEVCRARADAHALSNITFTQGNAQNLRELMKGQVPDIVVFFAVLEHMTYEERQATLRAAYDILPSGKLLVITGTPNRLWFFDDHTSQLPFFHWLPDEIAFEYSRKSAHFPFNSRYRLPSDDSKLSFIRDGRGMSYHELELALDDRPYRIVSDQESFLMAHNPLQVIKRVLRGEWRRERMLRSYARNRHKGMFRPYLNLILQKTAEAGGPQAPQSSHVA